MRTDFSGIVNQMVTLFILIILGYFLAKRDILDKQTNKKLSGLIMKVSSPALIISSVISYEINASSSTILLLVLISVVLFTFLIVTSVIVPKLLVVKGNNRHLFSFMTIFSNIGFMGFPVIESIYGTGAIFYASIFNLPFNLLLYTVGISLAAKSGGSKETLSFRKCINPGVISVVIAIILFVTRINVPILLTKPISLIGSLTTPLSMLIIGVSLSDVVIKEIFNNFRMYLFTIIKLAVIPLLVYLALSPFDLDPTVIGVTVVIAGMPVATNAVIVSTEYKGNVDLASKGVFLTTMFSVITIPIIVYLLG